MSADLAVNIRAMRYQNGQSPPALIENLQFSVKSGSVLSFLGPTGAGKTTMFRIIAGLEQNFSGSVTLNGSPILGPTRDVQMVFQDFRLLPWKTVYENVAFALHLDGDAAVAKIVDRWLRVLNLEHRRSAYPKSLSGGEAARVALARVFVSPPKLLLLDEPFHNLDIAVRYDIQDRLIESLKLGGTTTLSISHNIEDAVYLSDEIYLLSASPMRIAHRVSIGLPRPRRHDDPNLGAVAAEVSRRILASSNSMMLNHDAG